MQDPGGHPAPRPLTQTKDRQMSRTVKFTPDPDRGRVIAERRRSNAAGIHRRTRSRGGSRRQAIAASQRGE